MIVVIIVMIVPGPWYKRCIDSTIIGMLHLSPLIHAPDCYNEYTSDQWLYVVYMHHVYWYVRMYIHYVYTYV